MYTVEIRLSGPTTTWGPPPSPPSPLHLHHNLHISTTLTLHHLGDIFHRKEHFTYLTTKQRKHQEMERPFGHLVGLVDPTTRSGGLPSPLYKSHSFLVALGLQHNTKSAPELKILAQNFIVEFPLVEVVLEKEKSVRKFECESSVKILRKRGKGAAEI